MMMMMIKLGRSKNVLVMARRTLMDGWLPLPASKQGGCTVCTVCVCAGEGKGGAGAKGGVGISGVSQRAGQRTQG